MALEDLFGDIADAIREKDGTTGTIVANNFPARVRAIQTGITPKTVSISFSTSNSDTFNAAVECSISDESGIHNSTKIASTRGGVVSGILANSIAYVYISAGSLAGISFDQGNWNFDLIDQGIVETGTTTYNYFAVMRLKEADANLYVY